MSITLTASSHPSIHNFDGAIRPAAFTNVSTAGETSSSVRDPRQENGNEGPLPLYNEVIRLALIGRNILSCRSQKIIDLSMCSCSLGLKSRVGVVKETHTHAHAHRYIMSVVRG